MNWRDQYRKCVLKDCRADFRPKREDQRFCCPRHAVKDRVARHRSRYINAPLTVVPEKPLQAAQAYAPRQRRLRRISIRTVQRRGLSKATTISSNTTTTATQGFHHASTGRWHDDPPMASEPHNLRNEGSRPSQTRAAKSSTPQRRDAPRAGTQAGSD